MFLYSINIFFLFERTGQSGQKVKKSIKRKLYVNL